MLANDKVIKCHINNVPLARFKTNYNLEEFNWAKLSTNHALFVIINQHQAQVYQKKNDVVHH